MTSLQNIDKNILSPVNPKFNRQILKMKMNDVVELQLTDPPVSLYKSYKENEERSIDAKMQEKIYDRIDGGMILGWLDKYDLTKTDLIVLERQKQKTKQDSEWSGLGERTSIQKLKDFLK